MNETSPTAPFDLDVYVGRVTVWLDTLRSAAVSPIPRCQIEAMGNLCEALLDCHVRSVSAAEAAMAEVLRLVVRTRCASPTYEQLGELRPVLRLAVIDLDLGMDVDVDDVGVSLSEVALWLHTDAESPDEPMDADVAEVLLTGANQIDRARMRDLAAQAAQSGPIEVHRPGVGRVLLAAGVAPPDHAGGKGCQLHLQQTRIAAMSGQLSST